MANKLSRLAVVVLVISWLPLLAAVLFDPDGRYVGNGLGLGLLGMFGICLAGLLWIIGALLRFFSRW